MPKDEFKFGDLVSVLIPAYNAELTIARAINSMLCQTYTNIEIIVVDDGSTDGTASIVSYIADANDRVRLRTQSNCGLVDTLNKAIKYCRGKYIARMDADDISTPNRIEQTLLFMLENSLDICGCYINVVDENFKLIRKKKYPIKSDLIKLTLPFETPFAHPAVIYNSSIFEKVQYNKQYENCEDYKLWLDASIANFKLGNCPIYGLNYMIHPMQVSNTKRENQLKLGKIISHDAFDQVLIKYRNEQSHFLVNIVDAGFGDLFSILNYYLTLPVGASSKMKIILCYLKFIYRVKLR